MSHVDFDAPQDVENITKEEQITETIHPVVIRKAATGYSKSEEPVVKITFRITDGPDLDKTFNDKISLQPQALWRMRDLLRAVGIAKGQLSWNEMCTKLTGQELRVAVKYEVWEGSSRCKADSFQPLN